MAQLLQRLDAIVLLRAHAIVVEVRVERDRLNIQAAQNARQDERRIAVRVVDDDPEVPLGKLRRAKRFQERTRIVFERTRREVQESDGLHRHTAKIFAEKQVFDFTFGALVDVDAATIEKLEEQRADVAGVNAHVQAPVASGTRRKARKRQRKRTQIFNVDADAQQARDNAAVHDAARGMRVAARHHGIARTERGPERLPKLESKLRGHFEIRNARNAYSAEER